MLGHPNILVWLRDVGGVLTDVSGNAHTVNQSGSPTSGQVGQFGPAWDYSTGGYHAIADAADLRIQYPFYAVSFQRNANPTAGWDRVISKDDGVSRRYWMVGTTDANQASPYHSIIYCGVPAGTALYIENLAVNGAMNRVVSWAEPGFVKAIINGTLYSVAGSVPSAFSSQPVYVGSYVIAAGQTIKGPADNVIIGKFTTLEDMWRIYHMLHPLNVA